MVEDRRAHERIDSLEKVVADHVKDHLAFEKALAENTELTRTIAENTSELVELVKGLKVFRRLVLFWAPFAGAVAAVIAWIKEIK